MKMVEEFVLTGVLAEPVPVGDERYAWMNTTFFVGEGRLLPDAGVQYRVSRPA